MTTMHAERTGMTSLRSKLASLAVAVVLAVLPATTAQAQQTTGTISGRVTDMTTGTPLSGITVILQGAQGEDAALTDDAGQYTFVNLPVGVYVVRFYNASSSTKVERPDLHVSAGVTLRADAAIPTQAAVEETYVIKKRAPAVDVGSARLGVTLGQDYIDQIPAERTFGDLMLKAPGAFLESSGGISMAGASGLENVYVMDGLNVTGMEYGDIMNRLPSAAGGSNLTLDFVRELQLSTGGYTSEFGGAMGGVVSVVTKSGSNEFHGSAFSYWSPFWLSANPRLVPKKNSALVGVDKPDYDSTLGFEVGGPIIKNKLFFWAGFSPRFEKSHFFRDVLAFRDDNGDGVADTDANGDPLTTHVLRTRTKQFRDSYAYGAKIDFLAAPDHRLTVGFFGTPYSSQHTRALTPGGEAIADPRWALQQLDKTNTDLSLNWVSQFMDRRVRLDAGLGWHREDYSDKSPYEELNRTNQLESWGTNLYDLERINACAPQSYVDPVTGPGVFNPCPIDNYHSGGYGLAKSFTGDRFMGDIKGTVLLPFNEIKAGIHAEYNKFDQTRYYSGPLGERRLIQNFPGQTNVWNFFSLPKGRYQYQFLDNDDTNGKLSDLLSGEFYKDELKANVKSVNTAYFLQDTVRPLSNLTIDAGLRFENQTLYDFRGDEFLSVNNLGPRVGVVYDPSNEGRSKVFAHFGRFYETIPMNLAARYFGGEGIAIGSHDNTACTNPPGNWTGSGSGEWQTCPPAGGTAFNGGSTYPIQPNIRGQYHDEIVAGFRRALTEDLVVGVDYTHRWLGRVIEDGTATDGTFVLANPGQISKKSLDTVEQQVAAKQAEVDAAPDDATRAVRESELGDLKSKLSNLKGLAEQPKPERTYDALTLTASKRFARNWMVNANYTYSRLIGNYNGLYDTDNGYFAPNGGNAYDTPELTLNRRGPLANDRPHAGRVDGYYQIPVGKGTITAGLSFSAYSGIPRNYVAQWYSGVQMIFLLPRGAAGRTPAVTQTDAKLAYRRPLTKNTSMEAFIDFFNVFNARTALQLDDNYTFDMAAPIVNGNVKDLKYAKNFDGRPLTLNPNFGQGTVFQAPFHGRLGLRFLF
jgi:hypothetical protein